MGLVTKWWAGLVKSSGGFERGSEDYKVRFLHRSDELVVRHIVSDRECDTLFVTFWGDGAKQSPEELLERPAYAQEFLLKEGYDVLSINKSEYNFYQDLSRDFLAGIINRTLRKYQKVFMYGGSGGGYAAIYYSIGTKAKFLTYSPRASIDPVCKLNRTGHLVHEPLSDHWCPTQEGYVIYDPLIPADRAFVEQRIKPAFPSATYIDLAGTGHGAFFFSEVRMIKEVVRMAQSGTLTKKKLISARRKQSRIYHYYLAYGLFLRGKNTSGLMIARRGLETPAGKPTRYDHVDIYNLAIKYAIKANRLDDAIEIFHSHKHASWFSSAKNKYSTLNKMVDVAEFA